MNMNKAAQSIVLDFYDTWLIRYYESTEEKRQAAKNHWFKIHLESVKQGNMGLDSVSTQILSRIAIVENGLYSEYMRNLLTGRVKNNETDRN